MVKNKVVFITGAARGIGYEIGERFAENGAKVAISDLNAEGVETAAQQLRDKGYDVIGVKCDVTNEEEVKSALDTTKEKFGSVDILINNAGMQFVSPIEEFPTEKFELLVKIMLTAPFMATKHVFPMMKQNQFGRIINMASINGLIGF
ncbi:SDR family NAD(P)-dependent oxidoreductase, partial [Peribacillus acanthi]|uniref:SDR family NAD(P)-dependent oxidoreductase n=1 Tax=Peribacillus acanthi TaxID=2171554 RepID=UPI001F0B930F